MSDIADTTETDAGDAVELALRLIPPTAWDGMLVLGKIATDPKAVRRHLRQLHDALASVTAGQDKLAADRAAFDEYERTTREELTAQAAKLREGQIALATTKDAREERLAERCSRINELERYWAFIGEDDDVKSRFRSAEFSALYKARSAYGYASDATAGLDGIAQHMAEKFPRRTTRSDPQGTPFPAHTTITHSPEPPVAARVRPSRPARAGA